MLRHSASAVCLTSATRDRSLGPRTYSSAHLGIADIKGGDTLGLSKRTSSFYRLGVSDEETCTTSDAGGHSHSCLPPSSSTLASRRQSVEAFEDAIEYFEPREPSPQPADSVACYSSYAFNVCLPAEGASPRTAGASAGDRDIKSKSVVSRREIVHGLFSSSARRGSCMRSYAAAAPLKDKASGTSSATGVRRGMLPRQLEAAEAAEAPLSLDKSQRQNNKPQAAATSRPEEAPKRAGTEAPRQEQKNDKNDTSSKGGDGDTDQPLLPKPKDSPRKTCQAAPKERLINRYSSVPALTAADELRMERFKEGLPKSMSAQEALKFKEDTLKKQQPVWGANPFESSAELPESVDWRTLLNAAGLADVADEDIKLEAEELQSKIDAYVPKSRFTWCSALLSCLWPMRS